MGLVKAQRPVVGIEEVVLAFVCNQCGKAAPFEDNNARANFHLFQASGGYGTEFPGDCMKVEFALCSGCLVKLVEGFKVEAPVEGGPGSGVADIQAFHTEREEMVTVSGGWLYTRDNMPPEWSRETADEYREWRKREEDEWQSLMHGDEHDWPWPTTSMAKHFKGGLYEIIYPNNWIGVFDAETKEPVVVYRALYDDSKVFARPLSMWNEQVDRDGYSGPRFRPVTTDSL